MRIKRIIEPEVRFADVVRVRVFKAEAEPNKVQMTTETREYSKK